jgi:hypothetical protein
LKKLTDQEYLQNLANTPVSRASQIRGRLDTARSQNRPAVVQLTQDILDTSRLSVPVGSALVVDLNGYRCDLAFAVAGTLDIKNGELRSSVSGAGSIVANNINFTGSAVVTGNIIGCRFINCVFPATFTTGTMTNCRIDGSCGDSDSLMACGVLSDCDVQLKGGLTSLDPVDSRIDLTGDWTNLSNLGTGSNILARNKSWTAVVSADGYSVLGRDGYSSGSAISITASDDGFPLLRRNGVLDFQQLQTSDISGLTAVLSSQNFTKYSHKTGNYTITYADNGTTFTNLGATSLITLTLPAATADGYTFSFFVDGYTGIEIAKGEPTDVIFIDGWINDDSAGKTWTSYTPGDYVTLVAWDGNTWNATSSSGVPPNSITDDLIRDSAGLSVIGRAANTSGDPADIVADTDNTVLRRSGTTLAFGTIAQSAVTNLTTDLAAKLPSIGSSTDLSVARWDGTGGNLLQGSAVTISDLGEIAGGRAPTVSYTSNQTLTASQSGTIFSNKDATGQVDLTLPVPAAGLEYYFFVDTAQTLRVKTNISGAHYLMADGYLVVDYFESNTVGDFLYLYAVDSNGWQGFTDGTLNGNKGDITVSDYQRQWMINNGVITGNHVAAGSLPYNKLNVLTPSMAVVTGSDGYLTTSSTISSTELGFLNNLTSNVQDHITSTSNPHSVTAGQVGNTVAQWNANQLQGRAILNAAPGANNVLRWDSHDDNWHPDVDYNYRDGTFNVSNSTDGTKKVMFLASGITTGTTRTLTIPNASGTIALTSDIVAVSGIVNSQIAVGADIALTKLDAVTPSMALVSDVDGYISAHADVSSTELGFLNNVTSNIQTQIDAKVTGPGSAVDNTLPRFDSTTGKIIQTSSVVLSDTQELSGHKTLVVNVTGTATLTAADSGKHYTNIGATALVTLTLPTVASALTGLEYKITNYTSFGIDLQPQTNEYIVGINYTATSPGTAMRLSTPGDSITITPIGDGYGFYTLASNGREKIAGLSVLGRATTGTGDYAEITASTSNTFLKYNGTILEWAAIPGGITDHTALTSIGVNTHSTIDVHLANSSGVHGITGSVVGTTDSQVLTNKTFADSTTLFQDEADNTKKLAFQLSGITTGTTRTLTAPDASGTIALTSDLSFISTSLTSANIIVGNGSNVATAVSMSGDLTIDNVGATTIGNDKVTFAKMQNSAAAGLSVIGRSTSGAADFAEIASSADGEVLMRSSGAIVWSVPAGGGDTVGDSSSTDNALAKFSGTSGKIIQNSTLLYQDDGRLQFTVFDGYIDYASGKKLKITQNGTEYWEFRDANGSLVSKVTNGGFGLPRISTTSSSADTAVYTFSNDQSCGLNNQGSGVLGVVSGGFHAFDFVDNAFQGVVPDPVVDGEDTFYGDAPYIFNEVSSTGAYTQPTYSWVETPDTGIGKYGPVNEFATFINGTPTFNFDSTGIYGMGGTFDPKLVYFPSTANKPAFTCRSSTQAGITMDSDKINLITTDIIRYKVDGYNLIGQESDFAPALYGSGSPVQFGRKGAQDSGLQIGVDNVVTLYVNNNPALTCPDSVTVNGRTAIGYSWELKSSATRSDIVYTFSSDEDTGLGNSADNVLNLKAGGTNIINVYTTQVEFQTPFKKIFTSSSTDGTITVDAEVYAGVDWVANMTTGSCDINISNLTSGKEFEIFVRNTNASSEKDITVKASINGSGHTTVNVSQGNDAITNPSSTQVQGQNHRFIRVRNCNGTFMCHS